MFGHGKREGPLKRAGREVEEAAEAGERAFNAAHVLILELTDIVREIRRGKGAISTGIAKTPDGFGVISRYLPPLKEQEVVK